MHKSKLMNESVVEFFKDHWDPDLFAQIWIFKDNECFSPHSSFVDNHSIQYQRTEDAHTFLIHPEKITTPIIFFHLIDAKDENVQKPALKTQVTIKSGLPLTLIECYCYSHPSLSSNTETELEIEEKAIVHHLQILKGCQNSTSTHILQNNIQQKAFSHYLGKFFSFDLSYHCTTNIHLLGKKAKASHKSLLAIKNQEKANIHLTTHHHAKESESDLLVRGLINDMARGECVGKVIVHPDAVQTKARLENKNLLLSEEAEMITRPLLEVSNDNIECSHGATVGQLDPLHLFYLKSRGIQEDPAIKMLMNAFISPLFSDHAFPLHTYLQAAFNEY